MNLKKGTFFVIVSLINLMLSIVMIYTIIFNLWGYFANLIGSSVLNKAVGISVFVIVIVIDFIAFCVVLGGNREKTTIAASTGEGRILITLNTMILMAYDAIKRVDNVEASKVTAEMCENGISFDVSASFKGGANLPESSALIQQYIKNDVETLCGIKVCNITVKINNLL